MWWPAIGGYYVGAMGLCLFNTVSSLSYFLTLRPSVNSFAELTVQQTYWSKATLVSELDIYFLRV